MQPLRVGYLLDDAPVSEYAMETIRASGRSQLYRIEVLIIQKTFRSEQGSFVGKLLAYVRRRGIGKLLERVLFAIIERVERVVASRLADCSTHFQRHALDGIDIPKLYVRPNVSSSGFVYRFSAPDVQKIRDLRLDVLIRGGSGILRGEILDVCKFGVLSFHHADNDVNRGGPPAFWEVFHRQPSTGFIIQRLRNELDGGDVLVKGSVPTAAFHTWNLIRLYRKANVFMHRLLERIAREDALPPAVSPKPYSYPLFSTPSVADQLRYGFTTTGLFARKLMNRVAGRAQRWGVAYQFVEKWESAALWRCTRIEAPLNRFIADPFIVHRGGRYVCYVEEYDFPTERGRIVAYDIDRAGYRELGPVLEEEFHLSYPYVFEHEDELYMCPETHEANEIRLYRCVEYPLKWELHRVLMRNVRAADTNIFCHAGRWWLLTSIDSSATHDNASELHVFYSDSHDSTDWIPHPQNPVIFDALQARNGGVIFGGEKAYRVFQAQGFNLYGESVGIAEITVLTPERYAEEIHSRIRPQFFPGIVGTHTFSFNAGLLAVDFLCYENPRFRRLSQPVPRTSGPTPAALSQLGSGR